MLLQISEVRKLPPGRRKIEFDPEMRRLWDEDVKASRMRLRTSTAHLSEQDRIRREAERSIRLAVVALEEPGLDRMIYPSVADAARAMGVTESAIRNSINEGYRCKGRLFWRLGRPESERKPDEPGRRDKRPVLVGNIPYANVAQAAAALHKTHDQIRSSIDRGWIHIGEFSVGGPTRLPIRRIRASQARERLAHAN